MKPLAHLLRPEKLEDYIGQSELLKPGGIIDNFLSAQVLPSLILYGPSGCGKTTLAYLLAKQLKLPHGFFNAAIDSKKELTSFFEAAKVSKAYLLIVDEVHRLNKDKQDLLLPYIEDGTITLIGLTTTNPYHSINIALRSRVHLLRLEKLSRDEIVLGLRKGLKRLEYQGDIQQETALKIADICDGDLRYAFNLLEMCVIVKKSGLIEVSDLAKLNVSLSHNFDKNESGHYDLLSAFQKSIRGSDVNAALYYLAALIESGDLENLSRRLLVTAYEDVGLANPALVSRVLIGIQAAQFVGYPEDSIILSNLVIELALAPKSKSANNAIKKAQAYLANHSYEIPEYLKLTQAHLAQDERYDYGDPRLWPHLNYLKTDLGDLYEPNDNQYETLLKNNQLKLKQLKRFKSVKKAKEFLK